MGGGGGGGVGVRWGGGGWGEVGGGGNFFFWHGASLVRHKSHIERQIWLNRSKGHFSRSERSNFALFAIGRPFAQTVQ